MDDTREALHVFLQQQGPPDVDQAAVLVGWALVSEWADDNGDRWLTRGWSENITRWHAHGMLHEMLYGNWDDE